jgi:hypothetical protein
MDFLLSAIPGLAIALALYFLYLVATKGLPAAWSWLKGVWTAGKADLAKLEVIFGGEIDAVHARIDSLEADLKTVKAALGPAPQPVAAPATQPVPAPAAR